MRHPVHPTTPRPKFRTDEEAKAIRRTGNRRRRAEIQQEEEWRPKLWRGNEPDSGRLSDGTVERARCAAPAPWLK